MRIGSGVRRPVAAPKAERSPRPEAGRKAKAAEARPRSAEASPGAWRGAPDSEIGRLVADMVERLGQSQVKLDDETALSLFSRAILDNRAVTNEQLLAMRQATVAQMADSPEEQARTLERFPEVRKTAAHQFCIALFGAALGVDPQELSAVAPSLGLTGAPDTPLLYLARRPVVQRNTALHDLTEHLHGRAGVKGLNKAVWGFEGRLTSTLCVPLDLHRF